MVAESRTTATKTTVAMMTLELELDVATSSEKKEIIINIYFKTLNGEYTPTAYKEATRNCNCLHDQVTTLFNWRYCGTRRHTLSKGAWIWNQLQTNMNLMYYNSWRKLKFYDT